jgi:hypothetical protein
MYTCCLILFLLVCQGVDLFGQNRVSITQPDLRISDHKLVIKYGIQQSSIHDIFRIWVLITDSTGHRYNATSLSGDIGNNVSGGPDKTIVWDMEKDGYYRNIDIYVEIKAEKVEPVVNVPEKEPKTDMVTTKEPESVKEYKAPGIIIRSVLLPGWGQSVISGKNSFAYYLMGLAGYGCIGTSVYLNYKANKNYDQYRETYLDDTYNAIDLYDKAHMQYNTSIVLGFCAAAIWVADITWASVSTARYRSKLSTASLKHCRIYFTCDAYTLQPGIKINLNF